MIAVVGLGNIGIAIAERMVVTGQPVFGVDLSPERRAVWNDITGLTAADSLEAVEWDDVDRVVIIVRLTDQAHQVLTEIDPRLRSGVTVFVSTTLELEFARGLGAWDDRPWHLVELPVSGGQGGARAGTLTVMAAGNLDESDEAFLKSTIAAHVVQFPRFGDPSIAKLINNVTAGYNARAFADMIVLGHELGLDVGRLDDVLRTSSGGSWMGTAFRVLVDDLLAKDVKLLWDELDGLPTISLAPDSGLETRLEQARTLLVTADDPSAT